MIPNLNSSMIYDFLGTVPLKNEEEMFNFMYSCLPDIIFTLYSNSNFNTKYKNLFTNNPRFLAVLNQVLTIYESEQRITEHMSIYINAIIYWYIVNEGDNQYIRMLWYMIASTINREYIYKLKNLYLLDSELCNFLAISNKSSLSEIIRIQNVNFTICTSAAKVLSIEDFVNIYKIFYLKSFKNLLLTTLFDCSIPSMYYGKENTSEAQMALTNNNNSIAAVLTILETMNPYDVTRYLRFVYSQYMDFNYDSERLRVRFSQLNKNNYPKIILALENLKKEHISFP